ncbi:MAG TPA: AAA family ATPase [Candidatus Saccharimonadales bacterium]|nr:AAA family ATPase [Candidatus Saccharimonadales bacterium]
MFDQIVLHDSAKLNLEALAARPPQGILFVGPEGIGKMTVADKLALHLVDHPTAIRVISPDEKGTIAIETIRELYKATRAKQDGHQVIVVERADRMSLEAENAFLKLLEEPRAGLTFMLTTLQLESLLPTILSRIQHLTFAPLPDDAIRRLIMSKQPGIAQSDLSQMVFLAQGRPGVALQLLEGDALPKQRDRMQVVKQLLAAKPHERFILAGKMAGSRDDCLETLSAMARVVEVQLSSATSTAQATHWTSLAEAIENAQLAISRNGNVKAQLLQLFSRY